MKIAEDFNKTLGKNMWTTSNRSLKTEKNSSIHAT